MMIGRTTKGAIRSTVGFLLITGLVVAQGLQAAALRSCPHHGGAVHHGDQPSEIHAGTGSAHGEQPPVDTPDRQSETPDPASHDGPCDCLGPCGASAAVEISPPAEAAFTQVAPRRIASTEQPHLPATLRAVPFALPFANAPPA